MFTRHWTSVHATFWQAADLTGNQSATVLAAAVASVNTVVKPGTPVRTLLLPWPDSGLEP